MSKKLDKYKHQGTDKTETISFKISPDDKEAFLKFCKDNNIKTGMVLRDLLSTFMKENS